MRGLKQMQRQGLFAETLLDDPCARRNLGSLFAMDMNFIPSGFSDSAESCDGEFPLSGHA